MVGQFSLGLAIASPVLMLFNLQLRAVQATDTYRSYRFDEYLLLRTVTTLTAVMIVAAIVTMGGYERRTAAVILAVTAAKGLDTVSDIHYGLFQRNDRLDQMGLSMMIRGVLSVIAIAGGVFITSDIFCACLAMTAVWLAELLLFDSRSARQLVRSPLPELGPAMRGGLPKECKRRELQRVWELIKIALPLGIVTAIASLNLNIPRYFIHCRMGEEQLGVFSAMAYTTIAVTLVGDALGHSGIPNMARLYAAGRFTEFCSVLVRLFVVATFVSLAALLLVEVIGARLLAVLYGRDYGAHSRLFTMLIIAAAVNCIASVLTNGITSARYFVIQIPLFGLVLVCTVLACARWVSAVGLLGGAWALVCAAAVRLVLGAGVIGYLLCHSRMRVTGADAFRCREGFWRLRL